MWCELHQRQIEYLGTTIKTIMESFTPYQLLDRPMYHLCVKDEWEAALDSGQAYFPPTFEQDHRKTHASMHADKLLNTANFFYKSSSPASTEWICIELDPKCMLEKLGVVTLVESPEPVGDQAAETTTTIRYPHIYGGIATGTPGVVTKTFPMIRDPTEGTFLEIPGLCHHNASS